MLMRKEFWPLPAQHFPRCLSPDALSLAVPQHAFGRYLYRLLCRVPLPVD